MDVKNHYVLNAVAGAAADISLNGGRLTIKANDAALSRTFDFALIKRGSWAKETTLAEVLQVSTVAYTYAVNKVFSFSFRQRIGETYK